MSSSKYSVLALAFAVPLFTADSARAQVVADLVVDYDETGATADVTEAVFPGSVSGTWNLLADDDGLPFAGTEPLLFRSAVGLEGGDGFAGSGSIFGGCCGPMPVVANDPLFDGATLPADTLSLHPGETTPAGSPEFAVFQYTATAPLSDAGFNYSFETPGGSGIDVTFFDNQGIELNSFNTTGTTADSQYVGDLAIGESFYAVVGNGPGNDPGGDQTFFQLSVEENLTPTGLFHARVDRSTGNLTIFNSTQDAIDILGITVSSDAGSLIAGEWLSISDNYDLSGDGSVDDNENWTVAGSNSGDLSEVELNLTGPRDGGAIAAAPTVDSPVVIDLGNVWTQTPFEDLQVDILRANGDVESVDVIFLGNDLLPFQRSDLNVDGTIDALDWGIFRSGLDTDVSSLSQAEAYVVGDLDGDLDIDVDDFRLFKSDFAAANPGGLAALNIAVPEPTTYVTILFGVFIAMMLLPRKNATRFGSAACRACLMLACFVGAMSQSDFASAAERASLFADYDETGAVVDTTAAVFPSTTTGTWSGFSDDDADPTSGTPLVPILFRSSVGLEGGDGFAGTGEIFGNCCGPMPVLSDDGLFDGVTTPPAGKLAAHPGATSETDSPEFLVVEYSATEAITGATLEFDTTGGSSAFTVFNEAGDVLGSGGNNVTGRAFIGDLAIGDKVFYVLGNGGNGPGGDQTFLDLKIFDFAAPLTITANTVTGAVTLSNPADTAVELDFYSIASAGGLLDASGWDSLEDQDLSAEFPAGDGTGNGWEESGGSGDNALTEAFLTGSSVMDPFSSIVLGSGFDPSVLGTGVDGDLTFQYSNPAGETLTGLVEYDDRLTGDYNDDGVVDAADYTVWRDNLGLSDAALNGNGTGDGSGLVVQADYNLWAASFGSAAASAVSVPEPGACVMLLAGLGIALGGVRTRLASVSSRVLPLFVVAVAVSGAQAAFDDRSYSFGDDPMEDAANAAGGVVGSGPANINLGRSLDSAGTTGVSFQDLDVTGNPTYTAGALSTRGASFDGNDRLSVAESFNSPNLYWNGGFFNDPNVEGDSNYPFNYDGLNSRGMQVWARSSGAITEQQVIVADSNQHVLVVTEGGNWGFRFDGGVSGTPGGVLLDSGLAVGSTGQNTGANLDEVGANGYTHLMALSGAYAGIAGDFSDQGNGSAAGAVFYVNGVAAIANPFIFYHPNTAELSIGSAIGGTEQFFTGELDDLSIFTWGDNTDTEETNDVSAAGQDYGDLNLGETNEWIKQELADRGVTNPGDVDLDGDIDSDDVNDFLADWMAERQVPAVGGGTFVAGDWISRRDLSDLNYDGTTDLADAFILHEALVGAGGSGLDFSLLGSTVPEPTTGLLLLVGASAFPLSRSRSRRQA